MKKIGKILNCVLLMALVGPAAWANVKVEATVDRNNVSEGETFTYVVTVHSDDSINMEEPRLPDLTGFDLSNSWTGSEARSTFSNGTFQVEQSRTFNYMLSPNKAGRLQIGPSEVVVQGQAYKTEPIVVTVQPSGQNPGLAQRPQQAPPPPQAQNQPSEEDEDPFQNMEEMFNQLIQRRGLRSLRGRNGQQRNINPNEAFFIDAEVDKDHAYVGEQITANWYIYTRGVIRDIDTLKYPSLTNFWKEEIELATRLNFESHVVNGLPYKRALLASYALFPIKDGTVMVDQYKAKCTVLAGDAFGFGRPYQFTKASKPIPIQVRALPTEGRPKDFSGAVGDFQVSANLDAASVPVNQPVTLKIRFSGSGNAKLIDLPPLNLPPSLELYDTKKDAKFFRDGKSYKDFEVLLIPRQTGTIQISPVTVSIFNPKTGKYVAQSTQSMTLQVLPGAGGDAISAVPMKTDQAPAKMRGGEMPGPIIDRAANMSIGIPWQWWFFPLLFIFGFSILGLRAIKDLGLGQTKEALRSKVSKRMKKLFDLAKKSDYRAVGVEATNLIYLVLGTLAGRGGANRELEGLLNDGPPSLRRELGDRFRSVLSLSESLAFAPEQVLGDMKQKQRLKGFLSDLEKTLITAVNMADHREVK